MNDTIDGIKDYEIIEKTKLKHIDKLKLFKVKFNL
jgi:hypothetical protein